MKKSILSIFVILFALLSSSNAQQCATDEMLEEYFKANPGERERVFDQQKGLADGSLLKGKLNNKAATYTIPVVVHVIHYNGDGNISRAQVEDGIRVLNEDFQRTNSDTTETRNRFKSIAADTEIEFVLANKAPDSSCTTGIVRINDYETYDTRNEAKALSYWDANNYLNVWLVNSISTSSATGTVLGFAQFPFTSGLSTYGLVVRHDEWGTIGTAVTDGRTATHEVGHCFNLFHTFQSNCGFNCHNSGDFVCDTPPVNGQGFGCDTTTNTCSNDTRGGLTTNPNPYTTNGPDQLENYMAYNNCQNLFTAGQRDRMQNALGFYSHLINLTKNSNLLATNTASGSTPDFCPPVAEMYMNDEFICIGSSITFADDSYGDSIVSYNWGFPGGIPATSASATPTVRYDTAGDYDVILRVTNGAGSDTLVISNIVHVTDSSQSISAFNYTEGFETAGVIGSDWTSINFSSNPNWVRSSAASYAGNFSAYLNNFNSSVGEIDYLMSPPFDMTRVVNPAIKFRIANKSKTGSERDVLSVEVSTDCGESWLTQKFLRSRDFSTGSQTSVYRPSSLSDWTEIDVSLTTAQQSSDKLFVRFNFRSGGGNETYIDDFRITGNASTVGISKIEKEELDFNIYPNPTASSNGSTIELFLEESANSAQLYVTSILGERVLSIFDGALKAQDYRFNLNTANLSAGVYFVSLDTENGRLTRKLIVK